MSDEKLKPCPFCGGEAHVVMQFMVRESYEYPIFSISCGGNELGCGYTFFACHTEADVIEAWNRRAERKAKRIIVANGATGHCNCSACGGLIGIQDLYCKHCGAKLGV